MRRFGPIRFVRLFWLVCSVFLSLVWAACASTPRPVPAEPTGAAGVAPEAVEIPDIEQFMQILSAGSPSRAPDGTVYYLTWETGVDQLYRIPPGSTEPMLLSEFEDGVEAYTLSPDGAFVTLQTSEGGSEQSDLHLLETATDSITTLLADPTVRFDNVLWRRDGSGFFYRSNQENGTDFHIYAYDIESRTSDLVARTPGWNVLTDVDDAGEKVLVVRYQSNADSDVVLLDLGARRGVTSARLTPHEGEVQYHDATFDFSGEIWVISNRDADVLGIGRLDAETGAVDYRARSRWEVESMRLSDDRRRLAYVTNEDGYGRLHLMDIETETPLEVPHIGDGITEPSHFEHGHLMLTFSSATRTQDCWELRIADGNLRQVTFSDYRGVDNSLFREPELIRYASFDGLEIPAFLYLPPGYEGGIVPTIIHAHGGPESQFRPYFNRHFQYLILNGFAVMAPNIRGSSGYGPDYMALDNYRLRLDAIRDIGAAADWLVAQGYTDEGHLGIKGGSYGGYVVMAAITRMPERFAAATEEVGIVNFVTFLENTADYRRALREAEYGPLSDLEFLESISPIHQLDRIQTPLLVIHGENDSRVPVSEARQVIEGLEARGQPVESLIFPNEGHGVRHLENRLVMYRRMVDFFKRHLVGGEG